MKQLEDGDQKCERLPASRTRRTKNVEALECERDAFRLNVGWFREERLLQSWCAYELREYDMRTLRTSLGQVR